MKLTEGYASWQPPLTAKPSVESPKQYLQMIAQAKEIGLPYAQEVFADRAYEDDGTLVARTKPGAMITDEDEAVSRVIRMIKEHRVKTVTGNDIEIVPDSVCVHGDSKHALEFVRKIRSALLAEGICIEAIGSTEES